MKKSVLFLINGLGIEKPKSYSIALNQVMPNLSKTRETSYFTTAVTSSLEYKGAYQRFFLGDTYAMEIDYIKNNIINDNIKNNSVYQSISQNIGVPNSKLHFFVEPTNDKVVDQINSLVNTFTLENNKEVYLHLLLSQQTVNEYDKLISIINYIKFHLNQHITVGFILGKESLSENITKEELDYTKKLLFYCSAERWTETEKKLDDLKLSNIRPCQVKGFCTTNKCFISNNDTIIFFNTKRDNYDNIITSLMTNSKEVFKEEVKLNIYSLIRLYTNYQIPCLAENIVYSKSLSNILEKYGKKALIYTDQQNMSLVNFYANGLSSINNPSIVFANKDDNLYNKEYVNNIINNSIYDFIIFDYQMDVSTNINNLKEQLSKIDVVVGNVAAACENKNTLIISSLYGLKKELPVAEYDNEIVLIDYEMQIPIFFFDYSYPKSKYDLFPGETYDILSTSLRCIIDDQELYSLIKPKSLVGSLLKIFIK